MKAGASSRYGVRRDAIAGSDRVGIDILGGERKAYPRG
jgi:hypothetical protein